SPSPTAHPPRPTLFPYTTLFRSVQPLEDCGCARARRTRGSGRRIRDRNFPDRNRRNCVAHPTGSTTDESIPAAEPAHRRTVSEWNRASAAHVFHPLVLVFRN